MDATSWLFSAQQACKVEGNIRPKRSDSEEKRELEKASEKTLGDCPSIFRAFFFVRCSPHRCPILQTSPPYLNAWKRLKASRIATCEVNKLEGALRKTSALWAAAYSYSSLRE